MTRDLVIATRSGTVTAPDGTLTAITRGRTVADAQHPAVLVDPRNWMPFEVELKVDDAEEGRAPDDAGDLVAEYGQALDRIAEAFRAAGLLPVDVPVTASELADLVVAGIESDDEPEAADQPPVVAPPAPPRKRTAPKA